MTLFLASVRNTDEAETALGAGADIIDLKEPGNGALGALDPDMIRACVARVAGRAPVSATIGDLPMLAEIVRDTVRATASLGVDYVKLGLFPEGDARRCLDLLEMEARTTRLILVVFTDAWPVFDAVAEAARIGACGVMLDTRGKDGGALLDHLSIDALAGFVVAAKARGLNVGLAGSLSAAHVPLLLPLLPDLIGFRGALCRNGAREAGLNVEACAAIRALIPPVGAPAKPELAA
jgi:(5-formylfuran-3-yl)methyl phosphate synthase